MSAYSFIINRYQRPLRGLRQPLKVAHLSDLHVGFWIRRASLERWVAAAVNERPDLIVITGDMTDSARRDQVLPHLKALAGLKAPLGVWAVWGNHDYRFNNYQTRDLSELEGHLGQVGIEILKNRGSFLREDFYLAGVDDWWEGEPDAAAALMGRQNGAATVLLSHNPDFLYEVPQSVDLTLCGHTHGGQIVLPGYGPAFTSSKYKQKFASGWVDDPVPGFISRGLGVASLPLRVNCPAELVIHQLVPQ